MPPARLMDGWMDNRADAFLLSFSFKVFHRHQSTFEPKLSSRLFEEEGAIHIYKRKAKTLSRMFGPTLCLFPIEHKMGNKQLQISLHRSGLVDQL